jgi:hypothetical protein
MHYTSLFHHTTENGTVCPLECATLTSCGFFAMLELYRVSCLCFMCDVLLRENGAGLTSAFTGYKQGNFEMNEKRDHREMKERPFYGTKRLYDQIRPNYCTQCGD